MNVWIPPKALNSRMISLAVCAIVAALGVYRIAADKN
jgi:hypothetical protein